MCWQMQDKALCCACCKIARACTIMQTNIKVTASSLAPQHDGHYRSSLRYFLTLATTTLQAALNTLSTLKALLDYAYFCP
jgi:hypothetical protein